MEYSIRNMRVEDVEFAARCTATEGWLSETIEDFENFLAFDPKGCFVAEVDKKPVGICTAVNYGTSGFIGELVVLRDFRGNKIGTSMMKHAISYLKNSGVESIFLDADLKAVKLYESLGFKKIHKSLRFTGKIDGKPNFNVHPMLESDLSEIFRLDIEYFGADRTYFLERKFKKYSSLCKLYKSNGTIKGYLFAKESKGLVSIGPWCTTDSSINPLSMLEVVAYEMSKINFRIGIIESNRNAVNLLRNKSKLAEGEFCIRMRLGNENQLGLNPALFGIGSAAKG